MQCFYTTQMLVLVLCLRQKRLHPEKEWPPGTNQPSTSAITTIRMICCPRDKNSNTLHTFTIPNLSIHLNDRKPKMPILLVGPTMDSSHPFSLWCVLVWKRAANYYFLQSSWEPRCKPAIRGRTRTCVSELPLNAKDGSINFIQTNCFNHVIHIV